MIEIIKTNIFDQWLRGLRNRKVRARIEVRLRRLSLGNPGDVKPVGHGISEMRISHGPGYRVYYLSSGPLIVVLLCGGDKRTQARDIKLAKSIAEKWMEQES